MNWLTSALAQVKSHKIVVLVIVASVMMLVIAGLVVLRSSTPESGQSQRPPVAASAKQLPEDILGDCVVGEFWKEKRIVRGFCPQIAVGVDMDNTVVVNEMSWFFPGHANRAAGYAWMPLFHNDNPRWSSGHNYDELPGKLTLKLPPLAHDQRLVCWAFLTDYNGDTRLKRVPDCGPTFDGTVMEVPPGLRSAVFYIWDPRMPDAAAWTPTWVDEPVRP